jgi:uncharacterized protein involved in outer membrane biogenesis
MVILRVLKWIVITFTVVVLAAVLYLSFADLNWMKPRIESAVADATGRRLQIGGAFDLDIVPSPAILLEDVSISNADWGSEPMLATIGHVSARLGFRSLSTCCWRPMNRASRTGPWAPQANPRQPNRPIPQATLVAACR